MSRVTIYSHLPGTIPAYFYSAGNYEQHPSFILKIILAQTINYLVTLLMKGD